MKKAVKKQVLKDLNRKFYLKITHEEVKRQRTQEAMNELEVSGWLVALSMIYTAVCWFCKDNHFASLVANVILLIAVSWTMLRIKKKVDKRDEEGFGEPRKFCVIDMHRQYEVGRLSQE